MSNEIVNFIPPLDQIDPTRLSSVEARLVAIIQEQFPDMDVGLNSVFRDVVLTPLIYLIAGAEQAAACMLNDLDLSNLIAGTVCDCDFARRYLQTLGVAPTSSVPSIATVRLRFNDDAQRTISNTSRMVFADSVVLKPFTVKADTLTIIPTASFSSKPEQNVYKLSRLADGSFFVDLPVYGASTAALNVDGATGTTDIEDSGLIGLTLVSPLVPYSLPESIQDMAVRAQKTFPSSALTTRSSSVSFFLNKLTNLAGVSPVLAGDAEMMRGGQNLFGVQQTAVDFYPKGKYMAVRAQELVQLTRDITNSRWIGGLNLSHTPLRIRRFLTVDGVEIEPTTIYGASKDNTRFPGLSGAFSTNEELGVEFSEAEADQTATGRLGRAYSYEAISNPEGPAYITLNGQYSGSVFHASPRLRLTIWREADAVDYFITNQDTGETAAITTSGGASKTVILTHDTRIAVSRWLAGMEIVIEDDYIPSTPLNINFELAGDEGEVIVEYDYDPMLDEAAHLIAQEEFQGAFDTAVIAPRPFVVENLDVEYRTAFGRWVDTGQIKDNLEEFAESAVYPGVFDESGINDIVLYGGAKGVRSITTTGRLYATLATAYLPSRVDPLVGGSQPILISGTDYTGSIELTLSNGVVPELVQPTVQSVIGQRNLQTLLDRSVITLTEARR